MKVSINIGRDQALLTVCIFATCCHSLATWSPTPPSTFYWTHTRRRGAQPFPLAGWSIVSTCSQHPGASYPSFSGDYVCSACLPITTTTKPSIYWCTLISISTRRLCPRLHHESSGRSIYWTGSPRSPKHISRYPWHLSTPHRPSWFDDWFSNKIFIEKSTILSDWHRKILLIGRQILDTEIQKY